MIYLIEILIPPHEFKWEEGAVETGRPILLIVVFFDSLVLAHDGRRRKASMIRQGKLPGCPEPQNNPLFFSTVRMILTLYSERSIVSVFYSQIGS